MTMVTIIGRGHSGTRAISQTLSESGVYMGEPLNRSADLIPPENMYEACRVAARSLRWKGGLSWDWSAWYEGQIPGEFVDLIQGYLASVLGSSAEHRGWKIPETTLVFPWIARLYPDIKYIYWIRNPRDSIVGRHKTDDLADFGVPYPATEDLRLKRAISWWYQYTLVHAAPKPKHWIEVRFEDFCLRQEETLARLEAYLEMPLARVEVRPEVVGRYKTDEGVNYFDFLEPAMIAYGYEY